jgi:hypothetical protein
MLLVPIEWTADGWPRAKGGYPSRPLAKPHGAPVAAQGLALSGFSPDMFGTKLAFFKPQGDYLERAKVADGAPTLAGRGTGPADASPLLFVAGVRRTWSLARLFVISPICGPIRAGPTDGMRGRSGGSRFRMPLPSRAKWGS